MRKITLLYGIVLALVLLYAVLARAEAAVYELKPAATRVSVKGSSPLHGFTGNSSALTGGPIELDETAGTLKAPAELRLPVLSIGTGNEARDHALQYTLRSGHRPEVVYTALSLERLDGDERSGHYRLSGRMDVGGASRDVVTECEAVREPAGLRVRGRLDLSLSMFGLRPPGLAGLMRLRDEVEVTYETLWTQRPETA